MREMKNSGVEWIGEIPSTWRVMPLKALFSFGKGLPITKENLEEAGVPVISYGQIHAKWNSGVTTHDNLLRYVNRSYLESNPQSLVQMGDFIMADTSEDREGCGNCAYIDVKDVLFAGYHTIILRSNYNADNKYLAYLFLTDSWRSQIRKSVSGVKLFSISRRILGSVSVLLPDNTKPIVHYLDSKCSQIDTLIQNVQTQIEKLKAYKLSLITEVVTKGLDPTVPMKDSGVDWIGEIPEHWDVVKLKYITKISRGLFNHRPRNDSRLYDGEYPFIQTGDVARSDKYITTYSQTLNELGIKVSKVFPKGTITMTIAANVGDDAILNFNAYFPDSVVGFTVKDGYDENYVYYLFKALKETFVRASIANTQLNLNIERSKEIRAAISYDTQEQKRIAFHLDKKCSQIDRLIAIKQAKIEKLEQYKRSLIYEYVTGKKEVV